MQLNHRGTRYRTKNASVQFLRDIVCPRFSPAAKVELGMLNWDIPDDVRSGRRWTMPGQYELRTMAARILAASPRRAPTEEDLARPPAVCRMRQDLHPPPPDPPPPIPPPPPPHVRSVDERDEDELVGWDAEDRDLKVDDHLQGYGGKIHSAGFGHQRGTRGPPPLPPDPRIACHRRQQQRRPPCFQARCKSCGKYGHKEARYEYLVMLLWCRKYMMDKLEEGVVSVFAHWNKHNH